MSSPSREVFYFFPHATWPWQILPPPGPFFYFQDGPQAISTMIGAGRPLILR